MQLNYPVGPQGYPEDFLKASAAYRRQAWVAMLALLAFAAFYLALCGWFAWKAWSLIKAGTRAPNDGVWFFLAGAAAAFIAVFMLKAVWFVKRGGTEGLTELTRGEQPGLFAFLDRLADEARAPRPRKVFVSARVNAAVFYDLSALNLIFPSRKNLEIGLALVNVLSASEFKAVLAHEFGHFAQRSMAVGRWVYVAQQIAGHVVSKRDGLDKFLSGLSRFDLRVAWVGWILSLVVWAIRSVVDTFFRMVLVAERALSREMEFQADRVAVSLTGSDALIQALYRCQGADMAWDRALAFANAEVQRGRTTADLFEVQARIIAKLRDILDDPSFCAPAAPQGEQPASHRIFEHQEVQVSRMWASHPLNHEREANAKEIYLGVPLDETPAWSLFRDADALKLKLCAGLVKHIEPPLPVAAREESMAALDLEYERESYKRMYRGAYLSRSVTRYTGLVSDLHAPDASPTQQDVYPESLSADLKRLEALQGEKAQLLAMRDGIARSTDGSLRFRSRSVKRKDLAGLILEVEQDTDAVTRRLDEHERLCRTAARALARRQQGGGWEAYLGGLVSLLHYAEHMLANILDAHGALANVVAMVTAKRKVSDAERGRVLQYARELHGLLMAVDTQRPDVQIDAATLKRMDAAGWSAMLGEFKLGQPSLENLGDWMNVIDGWVPAITKPLARLRRGALDQLLATETRLRVAARAGVNLGEAPAAPVVPASYPAFAMGSERPLQQKLDWWSRFQVADGWVPGAARLVVAGGIIGTLMGMSASVGTATLWIHNGLDRAVVSRIGSKDVSLAAGATSSISVDVDDSVRVSTRTLEGKEIESFRETPDVIGGQYVYNIALASPLVEWTAGYGNAPGSREREVSYGRWFYTPVNAVLTDPPQQIQTKGGGGVRTVLSAPRDASIRATLNLTEKDATRKAVALVHARWDSPQSRSLVEWLAMASASPEFPAILRARLDDNPMDIGTLRMEQDAGGDRAVVCKRHADLAARHADRGDLQYIAVRCMPFGPAREAAFGAGYAKFPASNWFAFAAAYQLAAGGNWPAASKAYGAALKEPALAEGAAQALARVRRLEQGEKADIKDLLGKSALLQGTYSLETGTGINPADPARVYFELHRGQLAEAAKLLKGAAAADTRALRLLAASDGAPADLVEKSLALAATEGIDSDAFWSALGLALRHGRNTAPLLARLDSTDNDDTSVAMRKFVDIMRTTRDVAQADAVVQVLEPQMRGQAYVLGIIVLGEKAPAPWRDYAKKALMAGERPYLG